MEIDVKALVAEFIGTFWLVLGGCGSAVLAADFGVGANGSSLGLGFVGVSLAFGLTVLTGAYALGHVSGGHFNPAVTIGLVVGGRFRPEGAPGYIVVQVLGGLGGAATIYAIASGRSGWEVGEGAGAFASNGYGEFSPGAYSLAAALLTEVVMTAVFLIVIMGATAKKASPAMGGLAIGLALTLIHLISIPVTNTSVNPARSTSQAIFVAETNSDSCGCSGSRRFSAPSSAPRCTDTSSGRPTMSSTTRPTEPFAHSTGQRAAGQRAAGATTFAAPMGPQQDGDCMSGPPDPGVAPHMSLLTPPTGLGGLTSAEASRRLAADGPNQIIVIERRRH